MAEGEIRKVRKILGFGRSGETFEVEIVLKNVSPVVEKKTIFSILYTLYEKAKNTIFQVERNILLIYPKHLDF